MSLLANAAVIYRIIFDNHGDNSRLTVLNDIVLDFGLLFGRYSYRQRKIHSQVTLLSKFRCDSLKSEDTHTMFLKLNQTSDNIPSIVTNTFISRSL